MNWMDRLRAAWRSFVASFDYATRSALARIAVAGRDELPTYVTKQARHDDGTPMLGADGKPLLLHQDGRPLGVIELAVLARQEELRGG